MLNINVMNTVADNVVVINGVQVGILTDTDAQKVIDIVRAMANGQSVSDVASTPVKAPKVYADAVDVDCKWVVDGTHVGYTLADGKYVGQSGARKTLNKRLREAGATWVSDKKAWVFSTKAKAEKFASEISALVTADEINECRAKAQARAEKKAQRA